MCFQSDRPKPALTRWLSNSFCEEDYVVTFYLAEFINALTNIAYGMLVLAVKFSSSPPD